TTFILDDRWLVRTCGVAMLAAAAAGVAGAQSSPNRVEVVRRDAERRVDILVGGKPFTSYIYPTSVKKPVLFPIYASSGTVVTRGWPLEPKAGERVDHPHHIGLWLNYENVNGLDFWNNSSAIAPDKKASYGWIKLTKILETKSGEAGGLTYSANWQDINKNILLEERTTFRFEAKNSVRI